MSISFTEILGSWRPRIALEEQYNASAGGSGAGGRDIYIMGERLATGTLAANAVSASAFADADAAVAAFGAGSFGAFMARQVFRGGKLKHKVFGVALAEPAGVAATQKVTFAVNATSNGVITLNVAGAIIEIPVESGDTPTLIALAAVAAWNELDDDVEPPFTPTPTVGAVLWAANNKGASANTAPVYQIITGDEPSGTTVTVAGHVFGANPAGDIVAGTLYPTITTALANMATIETPIIVHGWNATPDGSTKEADLIRDHLIAKCNGEGLMRGSMVTAITATVANCVSWVAALDDSDAERCRVATIPVDIATNSPGTWHVAAACYVANAIAQQTDPAWPFKNVSLPYMIKCPSSADVLTTTELDTLIEGACCPLQYDVKRQRYLLVIGIGARLFGGKPQPWAVVDGTDYYRYLLLTNLLAAFPDGTKLAEDGETNLDDHTTTPDGILDVVHDTIFSEPLRGVLRNRETLWSAALAEIDSIREGQVNFTADHAVMMGLYTIAGRLRQRGGIIGNETA